ncbi:glutathione S-transferase E14-like [Trichoplusia ni]|uniref:Glutathione S-transferase E14-like n=1 Tax=Trichoplusia ni TaxID=7111 RepID=A0A7E5WF16_TRINI|nr:glutathione S-transferase E14-like [Trichoplusia ni]
MSLFRGSSCIRYTIQNMCRPYRCHVRTFSVVKKPILYGDIASPPVRFAMMTASVLNIDLDFHNIDLFKAENKTDSYKKINPLQKIPALAVNDDVICDSHAIALYLCRSAEDYDLYPDDASLKAKIDELMFFNSSVLFPIDSFVFSEFFVGKWPADESKLNDWNIALDYLDLKLRTQTWLTGDKMRLCDICCGTTLSSLEILIPVSDRHPNVKRWLDNLKALPCFEINSRGLKRLQDFVKLIGKK